jgi:stearoyl-CoA desaturase (Delta-9 desaturase)
MAIFFNFVMPIGLVCYFGESFHVAWYGNIYRYILGLNGVWTVNSVAHLWGSKPYDKNISPTDTYFVGFVALGEGWHNYHVS